MWSNLMGTLLQRVYRAAFVRCLLLSVLVLCSFRSLAGIEPFSNSVRGTLKKGDSLVVRDEKFRSALFAWSQIQNQKVTNIVTLQLFQDTAAVLPTSFSCDVKLKIEYLASPDQAEPLVINNVQLKIRYHRDSAGTCKLLDNYRFENAHWYKVTIEEVGSREFGSEVPPFMQLTSQIIVERKYLVDPSRKINPDYSLLSASQATTEESSALAAQSLSGEQRISEGSTTPSQIYVSWDASGYEEFDLEWTALDKHAGNETVVAAVEQNAALSADQLNEVFRFSATRVTLNDRNHYSVSLTFFNKYLFFRVRPVHYTDGVRIEGEWDYKKADQTYALFDIEPYWHEKSLNWQFTATYAEDGKKKEVISYFDGGLKSRQTVTLSSVNNGAERAVTQENVYDPFGRPVVSVLPAPVEGSVLKYYPRQTLTPQGQLYTAVDAFGSAADCETLPAPMDTASGASRYYSPANSVLGDVEALKNYPFYRYIPDAKGYPFSLTQYTKDNTGRIRLQGGVGRDFQPNADTSHTTKYYYGKPEQPELDRLFGNDVGYAEHYGKNMVVDANGQVSVSYVDASGKTIATALSGKSPENLEGLPSKGEPKVETKTILRLEQFQVDYTSQRLLATTTYLNSVASNPASFSYEVEKLVYTYSKSGWNICSNCFYDLTVRLVDDCGEVVYASKETGKIGSATANCAEGGLFSGTTGAIELKKIGEYRITFELQLSKDVVEPYTEAYVQERKNRGDWKTEYRFIMEYADQQDFSSCFSDCRTCEKELGTEAAFLANGLAEMQKRLGDSTALPKAEYTAWLQSLYQTLWAQCQAAKAACGLSPCDRYKSLMLADLSPGGQFALFDGALNPLEAATNVLYLHWRSVFPVQSPGSADYENERIEREDGTTTSPYDASFTLPMLVRFWKPEWAEKFLTFHPEYCKLQFCSANQASYAWDGRVSEEIETAAALSVHPATSGNQFLKNGDPAWLLASDPFFSSAAGAPYRESMRLDLVHYASRVLKVTAASEKSLPQFVDLLLYCSGAGNTNSSAAQDNWTDCAPVAECRVVDREWALYKDYYFQLKENYYDLARKATACSGACAVGEPVKLPGAGGCPGREAFSMLPGSSDTTIVNCPVGQVPVRFIYNGGKANGSYTLALQYAPEFSGLGLPSSVVFSNGDSEKQLCLDASVPLSAVYIASVSCGGGSAPNPDDCPFGTAGVLTLPASYQKIEDHYTTVDYNTASKYTYTLVKGRFDQPPVDPSYCTSAGVTKLFYNCFKLYLPNLQSPLQYYNVWLITCQEDLCAGAPVYNMERQISEFKFFADGQYYYIESSSGGTAPECGNPAGSTVQPCIKVAVNGTVLTFKNARIRWCDPCQSGATGNATFTEDLGGGRYKNELGTYELIPNTTEGQVLSSNLCTGAQRNWYNCFYYLVGGMPQTAYDVTVFFCPFPPADPCSNASTIDVTGPSAPSQYNNETARYYSVSYPQCYTSYTYYTVYENYSSDSPPYSSPSGDWGYYTCVKFNVNGTVYTYQNAWVLQEYQSTYTCGGGGGGGGVEEPYSATMSTAIRIKNVPTANKANPHYPYEQFSAQRQPGDRYYVSYTDYTIYLVKRDSVTKKGEHLKPGERKYFTVWQYRTQFALRVDAAHYVNLRNVWVARYEPALNTASEPTSSASLTTQNTSVPCTTPTQYFQGFFNMVYCDYQDASGAHIGGRNYVIQTINGEPLSASATVSVVLKQSGGAVVYKTVNFNKGDRTKTICVDRNNFNNSTDIYLCSSLDQPPVDPDPVDPEPPVSCPPLLKFKTSHFVTMDYSSAEEVNAGAVVGEIQQQLAEQIRSSCEGQADFWLQALDSCLVGRYGSGTSQYAAQKALLRQRLVAVCVKGGDDLHPFGASTTIPGQQSVYGHTSFKAAIESVLGPIDLLCNPWLLESPFPWESRPQAAAQTLSATSAELCQKLTALKQDYASTSGGGTFYHYLQNHFGTQSVNLSEAELNYLVKGCSNCKYLLEKDVPLPVFLEPGTKGCITKSDWEAAQAAFVSEFPATTLDTSHGNYGEVLSTYLNHRWGFTLTYDQYKTYGDSLAAHPELVLCNQPVYTPVTLNPYSCFNSLLAAAVVNGQRDYEAYVLQEKRVFRMNYVNTCLSNKPQAQLTSREQTYHYTLYYYDRAGNLVKTVPPAGVAFVAENDLPQVAAARNFTVADCSYSGPVSNTDKAVALQQLSDVLGAADNRSVELWLYNNSDGVNQVLATTTDKKFLFQTCVNAGMLNVDIYTLQQTTAGDISLVLSNHATVDISDLQPLRPWTHVVVQGSSLASGILQVYVNGVMRLGVAGAPPAGCSWEISGGSTVQLPEQLATLKQLRLYPRMLSAAEVASNAAQPCMGLGQLASAPLHWARFNAPETSASGSPDGQPPVETVYTGVYPAHRLVTTYRYNSLGQVYAQSTPDAGTSQFWYDRLGRLVASQNAEQANPANGGVAGRYSYTLYDAQGRISEVGEKEGGDPLPAPDFLSASEVSSFAASGTNRQLTQTLYDAPTAAVNGAQAFAEQANLRKRVAASLYRSTATVPVEQATYYSYDLAGNVKTLWQQVSGLGVKRLDYEYDLVSGKVNAVRYQHGQADQFYYQYRYDAENRLTQVFTNTEAYISTTTGKTRLDQLLTTHQDAQYTYYPHGPLGRVELGKNKVQGLDYAYTLQGWLKGINGSALDPLSDMGGDGSSAGLYQHNGRDVVAFSLGYFRGDYAPIGGSAAPAFRLHFSTPAAGYGAGLYNGNISHTTVALSKINNGQVSGYTYSYDQLNRLVGMKHHNLPVGTTTWSNTAGSSGLYDERYSYDASGNILSLERKGHKPSAPLMDQLTYQYYPGTNRLHYVQDGVGEGAYSDEEVRDVENQPVGNYRYDRIGNLTHDEKENLLTIDWTVYGKIRTIRKVDGSYIEYSYDAAGNRVRKFNSASGVTTYYVRDAQGNTLAVYGGTTRQEQYLYGSSRLGVWKPAVAADSDPAREYELTNHLGNVLATVSDRKLYNGSYFEAEVLSQTDYYPFGMMMPGRQFSAGSAYRYGFNGKENDNDVAVQDYGLRIYNPALGKFLSVDPLTSEFPELTPYQFASNSPIEAIDLDGAEAQSSKQANENSTQKPQQPSLLEQLDGALLGGQYKHERKVNALEVGIKQQTEEVSRYKDLKQQAMNDLISAAPGSPEAKASLNLYSQYDKEQQAHVSNLRSLILQRYKSLGEDKAIANYQDVLDKQLSILAFGTNAMVTAASFIPSGGSSAGFFSLTGVGTKGLTGGTEQWLRFGYSYSRVGQTPTIALRWGAGGRFSQTISSSLLRSANETLRTRRLIPGLRTWWNEPGHLHLMKMPTKEFTLKLIWNNTKSLF